MEKLVETENKPVMLVGRVINSRKPSVHPAFPEVNQKVRTNLKSNELNQVLAPRIKQQYCQHQQSVYAGVGKDKGYRFASGFGPDHRSRL